MSGERKTESDRTVADFWTPNPDLAHSQDTRLIVAAINALTEQVWGLRNDAAERRNPSGETP